MIKYRVDKTLMSLLNGDNFISYRSRPKKDSMTLMNIQLEKETYLNISVVRSVWESLRSTILVQTFVHIPEHQVAIIITRHQPPVIEVQTSHIVLYPQISQTLARLETKVTKTSFRTTCMSPEHPKFWQISLNLLNQTPQLDILSWHR